MITFIGCAGWTIPKTISKDFTAGGTHLKRYASRFNAVEIDSSFYQWHNPSTYERWANTVPEHFKFAVKVSKQITHRSNLSGISLIKQFISEVTALGKKLGPLLVQLPPSLSFSEKTVRPFLEALREQFNGTVVCEPRHESWFASQADQLLSEFHVARAAANPPPLPFADQPGGWDGLAYYRLHGSPRKYYSSYTEAQLRNIARSIIEAARSAETWCIFDNTASGAAAPNALKLWELIKQNPWSLM
jgi:uncharacterized protein YecE (DUF72 family)